MLLLDSGTQAQIPCVAPCRPDFRACIQSGDQPAPSIFLNVSWHRLPTCRVPVPDSIIHYVGYRGQEKRCEFINIERHYQQCEKAGQLDSDITELPVPVLVVNMVRES